jgi:hypothetical protein
LVRKQHARKKIRNSFLFEYFSRKANEFGKTEHYSTIYGDVYGDKRTPNCDYFNVFIHPDGIKMPVALIATDFMFVQITGLQINLYLEQPMEIQLFATFFQRRK